MDMLAFQDNPGMSKCSSYLFYSRCIIWISAKPICIAAPSFSSRNSFRAHQPGGRAETPCDGIGMNTAHSLSLSNAALIPTVTTGLPQPPLTSLGTQCHCLKNSCPNFFTIPADALIITHWCWFLGTVWATGMTKALLITQGFYLSCFLIFPLPFIHSWGKGEMLYIYSYVNNVEHISWHTIDFK